ncbi:hypothetical protein RIF29_40884 [Crotalaria pallida]|uniref:Uncharacterized protein n=1 Tax=Crotalaria pallida TaxID=3830 RepID=A0AAN9E6B1_CROPI
MVAAVQLDFDMCHASLSVMGVFTFVLRSSGGQWNAKQYEGDIEASASSTFDLQRLLVKAALAVDSSGGVQSSYSPISPSSAVFQFRLVSSKMYLLMSKTE